jgi:hypothetical protein
LGTQSAVHSGMPSEQERVELKPEDLVEEEAVELPKREALSLIEPGLGLVAVAPELPAEPPLEVVKREEPIPIGDPGEES